MDMMLLVIPAAMVIIAGVLVVFLNMRGKRSAGVAQDVMKRYVQELLPNMQETQLEVISLLEDALNAQHIWVIAYNKDGMFCIPSRPNPFSQTLELYEDLTPAFNLKKKLAANLFAGNKSEQIDYLPAGVITSVAVNRDKKKIKISAGEAALVFKFHAKDCFGADHQQEVSKFIHYLEQVNKI